MPPFDPYELICGHCIRTNPIINEMVEGKLYCSYDKDWHFADDKYAADCRKYCKDIRDRKPARDECVKESKKYRRSHGCHITTAVLEILGIKEDSPILDTFAKFKLKAMENPEYKERVKKYDVLAPLYANRLRTMEDKERQRAFAEDLYLLYIVPSAQDIENGQIESGMNTYRELFERLAHEFINPYVNENNININVNPAKMITIKRLNGAH